MAMFFCHIYYLHDECKLNMVEPARSQMHQVRFKVVSVLTNISALGPPLTAPIRKRYQLKKVPLCDTLVAPSLPVTMLRVLAPWGINFFNNPLGCQHPWGQDAQDTPPPELSRRWSEVQVSKLLLDALGCVIRGAGWQPPKAWYLGQCTSSLLSHTTVPHLYHHTPCTKGQNSPCESEHIASSDCTGSLSVLVSRSDILPALSSFPPL